MIEQDKCLVLSHTLGEPGDITSQTQNEGQFLASIRLQLIPAMQAAQSLGLKVRVLAMRSEKPWLMDDIGRPRLCLVGKLSHPDTEMQKRIALANIAALARLRRLKIPIGMIYSDNIIEESISCRSEMARDLLSMADMVIYPCKAMKQNASAYTNKFQLQEIVLDPWQVNQHRFSKPSTDGALEVLWFGHATNLKYLAFQLPSILNANTGRYKKKVLSILSDRESLVRLTNDLQKVKKSSDWKFRLTPWEKDNQPQQLDKVLANAHIVLLPSDENDRLKSGSSHNRAVDSIRAGCVTLGTPLVSYKELGSCMLIGSDLGKLLSVACANYDEISRIVEKRRGQALEPFSPENNLSRWKQVIGSLATRAQDK